MSYFHQLVLCHSVWLLFVQNLFVHALSYNVVQLLFVLTIFLGDELKQNIRNK